MKNLKKLLKNKILLALPFLVTINACSKEEQKEKNIVKINDSYLTKSELDSMISDSLNKSKFREELINEWIEDEILYNEAKKDGILEDKTFQNIINKSRKKLAITLLINKILEEQNFQIKDDEIKKYYDDNKNEFKLNDDFYQFKIVIFQNYDDAIKFREKLIESNFSIAENFLKAQKINYDLQEKLLYKNEIQPIQLLRILNILEIEEISTVLNYEGQKFVIIQLINKYNKNEIPKIEFVYKEIKQKLLLLKQKEFLNNYIKDLLSKHNIEIERLYE